TASLGSALLTDQIVDVLFSHDAIGVIRLVLPAILHAIEGSTFFFQIIVNPNVAGVVPIPWVTAIQSHHMQASNMPKFVHENGLANLWIQGKEPLWVPPEVNT